MNVVTHCVQLKPYPIPYMVKHEYRPGRNQQLGTFVSIPIRTKEINNINKKKRRRRKKKKRGKTEKPVVSSLKLWIILCRKYFINYLCGNVIFAWRLIPASFHASILARPKSSWFHNHWFHSNLIQKWSVQKLRPHFFTVSFLRVSYVCGFFKIHWWNSFSPVNEWNHLINHCMHATLSVCFAPNSHWF